MAQFTVAPVGLDYEVFLSCKDEKEFLEVYQKVKHIPGTVWSGCPVDEPDRYEDMIAYVKRDQMSSSEVMERANHIVKQYREILRS